MRSPDDIRVHNEHFTIAETLSKSASCKRLHGRGNLGQEQIGLSEFVQDDRPKVQPSHRL